MYPFIFNPDMAAELHEPLSRTSNFQELPFSLYYSFAQSASEFLNKIRTTIFCKCVRLLQQYLLIITKPKGFTANSSFYSPIVHPSLVSESDKMIKS